MMNDKIILDYINNTAKALSASTGVTTKEVSSSLGLQRSNVSAVLNNLVRQNKLVKGEGRPVKYWIPLEIRKPFSTPVASYKENIMPQEKAVVRHHLFEKMIGNDMSLKTPIDQAKAAVIYPDNGLYTLIIGPTGSGKTYFANAMASFAKFQGLIKKDRVMSTLNCADYANNPQLLMSYLFGHTKGAYTGAENERPGLLKQSDGTILFLDEVHRLPPEGQEMLFSFMDSGEYRPLGYSGPPLKAKVRIVCATTENPKSSLLSTFLRRIPIVIRLPAFHNREAKERLDLLKHLIGIEAKRIKREIQIDERVVKALLGSVTYGNVGQLKSIIQMVCAKGFLQNDPESLTLYLRYDELEDVLADGLNRFNQKRQLYTSFLGLIEPETTMSPSDDPLPADTDNYEPPFNLYDIIGDKMAMLKEENMSDEQIQGFISTDIDLHLKSFYRNRQYLTQKDEKKLKEIVPEQIINLSREIQEFVKSELNKNYRKSFIYALSLHVSAFLKRNENEPVEKPANNLVKDFVRSHPKELKAARLVAQKIEERLQVIIPPSEVDYLTMLITSLNQAESAKESIGIVVACHGNSTASSMVDVINTLLGSQNIYAYDMILEQSPSEAYDIIKELVKTANKGHGVLLLTDMGSLTTFGKRIEEELGVETRTHEMVSTPILLEAARKTQLPNQDLDTIAEELKRFNGYSLTPPERLIKTRIDTEKKPVIIAVCASGKGAAQIIKEQLIQLMKTRLDDDIEIITCGVREAKAVVVDIKKTHHIVATVGVSPITEDIPHLSLEQVLSPHADKLLNEIIDNSHLHDTELLSTLDQETCQKFLGEHYTFINPQKMIYPLWYFMETIEQIGHLHSSNSFKLNMILHLAGTIERTLQRQPLATDEALQDYPKNNPLISAIDRELNDLESQLNLSIAKSERLYIYEIYLTNDHTFTKEEALE